MLEKLSAVMDMKVGQMKRELEEVANKAHDLQMTELKRMKFSRSEPPSFKKKGHEVQYKHNERVKLCITKAGDTINNWKLDTCLEKLNEGKEQIASRQKLILLADKSEYGWKTVSEYVDKELADNEEDAKKIKKAEKEAQRKLNETRNAKKTRASSRGGFSCQFSILIGQKLPLTGCHNDNEMRNAICVDTKISIEWPTVHSYTVIRHYLTAPTTRAVYRRQDREPDGAR